MAEEGLQLWGLISYSWKAGLEERLKRVRHLEYLQSGKKILPWSEGECLIILRVS